MTPKTHCKNCVFAKYENDVQVDCSMGRHEKLGVAEMLENNFGLHRFCNTYRPPEWYNHLGLENALNPEETVLKEVFPRIGFFVRLNTDEDNAIEKLGTTIESIANMDGGCSYLVVVTDKVEYNEEIWTLFIQNFGVESKIKYHILQLGEKYENLSKIIDRAFSHAQNGWIMTSSSGHVVKKDTLVKLHRLTNLEMKQLVMVDSYDGFNGLIFPAFLFKFLNGNKEKVFQDEIIDSRAFIEKVKAAEERGGTSSIMSWEEFDAA